MADDNVARPGFGRRKRLAIAGTFRLDRYDEEEVYDFTGISDEEITSACKDLAYLRTHPDVIQLYEDKTDELVDWIVERGVHMLRFEKRDSTCFEDTVRQFLGATEADWQRFPDRYWNLTYDYEYYVSRMEHVRGIISQFTRRDKLVAMIGNNLFRPWRWLKYVLGILFK